MTFRRSSAAGDELRFAILDDEHVAGVVVHLGPRCRPRLAMTIKP
jgi:hypothetical protein